MNAFQHIMKRNISACATASHPNLTAASNTYIVLKNGSVVNYAILKGAPRPKGLVAGQTYKLQFDGASNPNPGPSSAGAVLFTPEPRQFLYERGVFMGHATNNEAEYNGLLIGLEAAKDLNIKNLLIEGDSNLIVNQVAGKYKVKEAKMVQYNLKIKKILLNNFDFVAIRHIYREENTHADQITKYVLQTGRSYIEEVSRLLPNNTGLY